MTTIRRYNTAEPAAEPITLAEAKAHLRVEHSDSDTEIAAMISAARDAVEQYTNRYWAARGVVLQFETFPYGDLPFRFSLPDTSAITALTYVDADFATQSLDVNDLTLDAAREQFIYSGDWPTDGLDVLVTFTVGADASVSPPEFVPQAIKSAILLYTTDLYEHRGAQSTVSLSENRAAMALMQPYRVNMGV